MEKNRMEAFSDGVFAIAITLLILDIKVPNVAPADLLPALGGLIPNLITYVFSFTVIGLYWVTHHQSLKNLTHIDNSALWLNVLFLLFVSFMPFPTALVARYPLEPWPLVIYGATLMAANMTGFAFHWWGFRHPQYIKTGLARRIGQVALVYATVNVLYLVAMALAFWVPLVSAAVYLLVLVVLIEYNRRVRNVKKKPD